MSAVACSAVGGLVEAQSELTKAGYRNPTVRYRPETEVDVLDVTYRTSVTETHQLAAEYERAAEIMWTRVPIRFDEVHVRATNDPPPCDGDCREVFDRTDLAGMFGPRDPHLDKDVDTEYIAIGLVTIAAIAVLIPVVVVLVVRRRRRRERDRQRLAAWQFPPHWGTPTDWGSAGHGQPPTQPHSVDPASPWASPSAYDVPPVYSGPPIPPPVASPAPWEPSAPPPPLPEPDHDIWERPPS